MNQITSYLYEFRFGLAKCVRVGSILVFLFGILMLFAYSVPMLNGNYESASRSIVGDKAIALFDRGLQRYKQEDYKGAVGTLNDAYNACLGKQGVVSEDKRKLAAQAKFLAGNALVKDKQLRQAVEAYKESLRLDPDNLEAKYNLEMLQQMNGGKGPAEDSGKGENGKGTKRGI